MQLYRFYKIPDNVEEIPEKISLQDKYPLYAITNNKKYAKRFISERNMDRFIYKKSEIEKSEYSEYANRHRGCVLDLGSLITSKRNSKTKDKDHVDILMTTNENMIVEEPNLYIFDEMFWYEICNVINTGLFNKKINKALNTIDFWLNYKLFTQSETLEVDDDYSAPEWYVDEVAYFVSVFGSLFK